MATVALSPASVGARPTLPSGAWRRTASRLSMTAHRIGDRFTTWLRIETRVDRYASYGALACGALAAAVVLL